MAVPLISQLCTLLGNQQFPSQLASILSKHNANESYASNDHLVLRIEASIWTKDASRSLPGTILLGCINLKNGEVIPYSPITPTATPPRDKETDENAPHTPRSIQNEEAHPPKRHKTVSGLRPSRHLQPARTIVESLEEDHSGDTSSTEDQSTVSRSVRQLHSDTGFPQRRKARQDYAAPVLEPTSTDKLIAGIWRQIYSPVKLSRVPAVAEPMINIRTGVSGEVSSGARADRLG